MPDFHASEQDNKKRLDKFLVGKFPGQTRSQIQKLIKNGAILVNEKKPSVHQFLKTDDLITVHRARPAVDARGDNQPSPQAQAAAPGRGELHIISDQSDYLVVNKPAGLLVHPAPTTNEPTLVDWLLQKYPGMNKIGEDPLRPGIVHRLDRDVSGLLVVAKTQDMFDRLKSQFKTRKIKKEYTALVYGAPAKDSGEINFNIDRSETADHKMAAVPEHENRGRKAVTAFEVVKRFANYTLLTAKPQTGRTHQIRVHLNAFGLPIVGDTIYKPKKLKTKIKMNRIFLHAQYLGFYNLDNTWSDYQTPLPSGLQEIINKLK